MVLIVIPKRLFCVAFNLLKMFFVCHWVVVLIWTTDPIIATAGQCDIDHVGVENVRLCCRVDCHCCNHGVSEWAKRRMTSDVVAMDIHGLHVFAPDSRDGNVIAHVMISGEVGSSLDKHANRITEVDTHAQAC